MISILYAFLATLFTLTITAIGSAMVFLFRKQLSDNVNCVFFGFASGVMIAASIWSLILPAFNYSEHLGKLSIVPILSGFLLGGTFIFVFDRIIHRLQHNLDTRSEPTSVKAKLSKRNKLLIFAITLHNIPEGLAIGVAFGLAAKVGSSELMIGAIGLALGIGIQNFPEGASVSLPLLNDGFSRGKAFLWGVMSAVVEPIAGIIGAIATTFMASILPFTLAFAAGAMIFVVSSELIPESSKSTTKNIGAVAVMIGFTVMMALDILLG